MTEWRGVHLPAAQAQIKTEIDLRRYLDERGADIYVRLGERNFALNDLPGVVRMMFVVRFVDQWRENGRVPYTSQDAQDAIEKAKALAAEVGGAPVVGVAWADGPKEPE
jgi:hypothetical protein